LTSLDESAGLKVDTFGLIPTQVMDFKKVCDYGNGRALTLLTLRRGIASKTTQVDTIVGRTRLGPW